MLDDNTARKENKYANLAELRIAVGHSKSRVPPLHVPELADRWYREKPQQVYVLLSCACQSLIDRKRFGGGYLLLGEDGWKQVSL